MGRQRQLPVYDNTEVASGVRDGDASAEHQDVVAVNDSTLSSASSISNPWSLLGLY